MPTVRHDAAPAGPQPQPRVTLGSDWEKNQVMPRAQGDADVRKRQVGLTNHKWALTSSLRLNGINPSTNHALRWRIGSKLVPYKSGPKAQ